MEGNCISIWEMYRRMSLNDSQLTFENGFPNENNDLPVLESTWGLHPDPATFNVVNAFDNSTSLLDSRILVWTG